MNDQNVRRYERATRVKTFLNTHSPDFTPGVKYHTIKDRIVWIVSELDKSRVGQIRTPLTKDQIIDELYADFKDISRTSRSIHQEKPTFPAGDYRYPAEHSENAATTHADHLLSLLEDQEGDTEPELAEKLARRTEFTDYEMDPDFVSDLRAIRDALDIANEEKHSDNQEGLEATAAINTLLNEVNGLVTRLHGLIPNKYKNDPDKIHAWKQASRIERAPRRNDPPTDPEPEP